MTEESWVNVCVTPRNRIAKHVACMLPEPAWEVGVSLSSVGLIFLSTSVLSTPHPPQPQGLLWASTLPYLFIFRPPPDGMSLGMFCVVLVPGPCPPCVVSVCLLTTLWTAQTSRRGRVSTQVWAMASPNRWFVNFKQCVVPFLCEEVKMARYLVSFT